MRIRASMLNAGQVCPGQVSLENATDSPDTPYTSVGKAGHKWLEIMATEGQEAADTYLKDTDHFDDLHPTLLELVAWIDQTKLVPLGDRRTEFPFRWELSHAGWYTTGTIDMVVLDPPSQTPPRATVIDWKFYNQPDMLKPLHLDMQMYAYAVGIKRAFPEIEHVRVHRVLCYYLTKSTLELDAELLQMAEKAVAELCEEIATNCNDFVVGSQCRSCFQADHCDAYHGRAADVSTKEIAPYEGGDFESEAQALRFLIAAPLITQRVEEGLKAAQRLVLRTGRPVADLVSGREWGPKETSVDKILDAAGCLGQLMQRTDQAAALSAAKTTKGGMDAALKKAGVKPAERRQFIEHLREAGCIAKVKRPPRFDWRRLKDG